MVIYLDDDIFFFHTDTGSTSNARQAMCVREPWTHEYCVSRIKISSFDAMPSTCDYFTRVHAHDPNANINDRFDDFGVAGYLMPTHTNTFTYRITKALSDFFCFWIKLPIRKSFVTVDAQNVLLSFLFRLQVVPCSLRLAESKRRDIRWYLLYTAWTNL